MLMLLWRIIFFGGLMFFSFIIGVLPQMLKPHLLPMMVAAYLIAVFCMISIIKPMLLCYFIVLSATTQTMVRDIGQMSVGNTYMSTSGLRWGLVVIIAFVINLYYFRDKGVQKKYWLYLIFLVYSVVIWGTTGAVGTGDKDIVWYGLPFIVGMFSYNLFLRASVKSIEKVDWLIRNSIYLVIFMFAYHFATGGLYWTVNGPEGDIVVRTVALYTSTILAVPLARWRYHPDPKARRNALIYVLMFLSTVFITISRMAMGTGLLIVAISMSRPRNMFRLVSATLIGGTLVFGLFMAVPSFRARMFTGKQMPTTAAEFFEKFDSSGRFTRLWPATVASGLQSPWFGQGPGTARTNLGEAMTEQKVLQEYPPHNEYLQVWHDFGYVGMSLVIIFYVILVVQMWNRWKYYDDRGINSQAYWSMAGFLSIFLVAFSSITANTLHYPFVMGMAFMILGISDAMHERYKNELEAGTVELGSPAEKRGRRGGAGPAALPEPTR